MNEDDGNGPCPGRMRNPGVAMSAWARRACGSARRTSPTSSSMDDGKSDPRSSRRARGGSGPCRSYERQARMVRRIRGINIFSPGMPDPEPRGTRPRPAARTDTLIDGTPIVKNGRAFDKDRSPDSVDNRRRHRQRGYLRMGRIGYDERKKGRTPAIREEVGTKGTRRVGTGRPPGSVGSCLEPRGRRSAWWPSWRSRARAPARNSGAIGAGGWSSAPARPRMGDMLRGEGIMFMGQGAFLQGAGIVRLLQCHGELDQYRHMDASQRLHFHLGPPGEHARGEEARGADREEPRELQGAPGPHPEPSRILRPQAWRRPQRRLPGADEPADHRDRAAPLPGPDLGREHPQHPLRLRPEGGDDLDATLHGAREMAGRLPQRQVRRRSPRLRAGDRQCPGTAARGEDHARGHPGRGEGGLRPERRPSTG